MGGTIDEIELQGWMATQEHKARTELERRISELEAKSRAKWQPIETAPVNKSVLIYIPNAEHYGEGIYRGLQVESDWRTPVTRRWTVSGLHMGRDCGSQQPTHWMPLPDPPEATK